MNSYMNSGVPRFQMDVPFRRINCQSSQLGGGLLDEDIRPFSSRPGSLKLQVLVQEKTNRYNENDGMSTLVHELAFGIVICHVWIIDTIDGVSTLATVMVHERRDEPAFGIVICFAGAITH